MKHRIRINGEIKELECQFGSGLLDKNGREIFEGDRVKVHNKDVEKICRAVFVDGVIWLKGAGCDIGDAADDYVLEVVD